MRGPSSTKRGYSLAQATPPGRTAPADSHEGPDPGREVAVLWIEGVEGADRPAKGVITSISATGGAPSVATKWCDLEQTAPSHRPAQARQHLQYPLPI